MKKHSERLKKALGRESRALVAASTITNTAAVLPVVMLGSLAVVMRQQLGFSQAELGAAVSIWYASSVITTVFGGRIADRIGFRRSMTLGLVGSLVALVGIAGLANSWTHVVVFLVISSFLNSIGLPGGNLALTHLEPDARGIAFGIKQSSVPLAALIAGLAVPVVALSIGWRWAMIAGAGLSLSFFLTLPRIRHVVSETSPPSKPDLPPSLLLILTLGAALGLAAAGAVTTFYVESAVASGYDAATAGLLLGVGGLCGVLGRIGWGLVADKRDTESLQLAAAALLIGSFGFLGIAFIDRSVLHLLGATAVVFAFGLGWNGLFHMAIVHNNPSAPASASGIAMSGMRLGGVLGPISFGLVVHQAGYRVAWLLATLALIAAAGFMVVGLKLIQRSHTPSSPVQEPWRSKVCDI